MYAHIVQSHIIIVFQEKQIFFSIGKCIILVEVMGFSIVLEKVFLRFWLQNTYFFNFLQEKYSIIYLKYFCLNGFLVCVVITGRELVTKNCFVSCGLFKQRLTVGK